MSRVRLSKLLMLLAACLAPLPCHAWKTAWVGTHSTQLLAGHNSGSSLIRELLPGTPLTVSDRTTNGYYQCTTSTRQSGWIAEDSVQFNKPAPGGGRRIASIVRTSLGSDIPRFNIRTNPVTTALFLASSGIYANLDLDIGVGRSFSIGPSLSYLSLSVLGVGLASYSAGLRVNVFFSGKRFSDGAYASLGASYLPSKVTFQSFSGSLPAVGTNALLGYLWRWRSGFNISLGGGGVYYSSADSVVLTDTSSSSSLSVANPGLTGLGFLLEGSLGFAF